MARDTNFLDLYRILDLTPDCRLAEFKLAYRRRVLVLHPDRRAGESSDLIAAERLQQLTTLYGAAMAFHRQHGRLPGAATVARTRSPILPAAAPTAVSHRRRRSPWPWLIGAGIAGITLWNVLPTPDSPPLATPPPAVSAAPVTEMAAPGDRRTSALPLIQLDTAADKVRDIEGEPMLINDNRWEYGPSWILLEQGRVKDWYSSPLRPLHTAGSTPAQGAP